MDIVEISKLTDEKKPDIDISFMLNFERKLNGASEEWLAKV